MGCRPACAAGLAFAAGIALAGCGSGGITLHGTYTDTEPAAFAILPGVSCHDLETAYGSPWYVHISADGARDTIAAITWHGNPRKDGGNVTCTGTWSAPARNARVAYELRVTGPNAPDGTDDIGPGSARQPISLGG